MAYPTWEWPGSRWWRVDLHAHSPESHDFRSSSGGEASRWKSWISAARDAGIDAIAVTDHNTADAVAQLQDATSDVEGAPILLPGVELTASDGSHLLILKDPGSKQLHIDDILSRAGVSVEMRGRPEARSSFSIEKILEEFDNDALVIGAHVNGPGGLHQLEGEERIAVLNKKELAAVEVNPNEGLDASLVDGTHPRIRRVSSVVWASDGHRLEELGQRFTWVKMTKPNLEGLHLALLDGSASLKPARSEQPGDPNAYASLAIESITIHKARYIGRQPPLTVMFNPWLNAIIGGRGTGKSTLVDICRTTLRRESELDDRDAGEEGTLRSFFDRRMSVYASRSGDGLLTNETLLEMVYRKDGQRFILSWSPNSDAQPIARLDGAERTAQEGDVRERFPVRIYSQKQLFALAQDPNALLAVIDDSQIVRGAELLRSVEQLATSYLSLCAQARAARQQASDLPAKRAALEDIRHKLEILQKGGHAEVFNRYRLRRQLDGTWQTILSQATEAVESVVRSAKELSVADLGLGATTDDDHAQEKPQECTRRSEEDN